MLVTPVVLIVGALLLRELDKVLSGQGKTGFIPPLWDGRASERIADIVLRTNTGGHRRAA